MCDCINIKMGSYDNQVVLPAPYWSSKTEIAVDKCLASEILELWNKGVITCGCCCGHNIVDPMINIDPDSIELVIALGYQIRKNNCRPFDNDTFYPKSVQKLKTNEKINH